jgi:hypothetical protein
MIRVGLLCAAALIISGCGALFTAIQPAPDDFRDWSPVPLAADPALSAEARESCSGDPNAAPMPLLFQDRRTAKTALVVFGRENDYLMCSVSHAGGGGFGAGGSAIGAPAGDLTIESGEGAIANSAVTVADGRIRVPAAGVRIVRADGLRVEASVGGGRWLAWWPGDSRVVRVVAYDLSGAEVAVAEPSR